ncbi:hypothetical protein Tco_0026514 [Tanacetum coccineum]
MFSSPNTMWVTTFKALHGQEGGLDNHCCNFNGTRSRIVGTSNFLHSKGIFPLNSFCFKGGCSTRIRFRKDIWIGDSPLLSRYNILYRLDQDKDCLIIDRIVNGQWHWNWSRANIGTRNTAYLRHLLMEISQIDLSIGDDTCTWSLADDGIFSVRSSRRLIDSKLLPSIQTSTLWDKTFMDKNSSTKNKLYLMENIIRSAYPNQIKPFVPCFLLVDMEISGRVLCNWVEWLKNPLLLAGS